MKCVFSNRTFAAISGCIPLLVQFTQTDKDTETCKKALQALHNLVNAQPDEKCRKRESRVLKLLDQLREYTESLKNKSNSSLASAVENPEGIHWFFIIITCIQHNIF